MVMDALCENSHSEASMGRFRYSKEALRSPQALWVWLAAAWMACAVVAVTLAGDSARRRAEAELMRQADAAAALHAAVLRSELEKHRSLPVTLADDFELEALLIHGGPARTEHMNIKLERLANQTRAAVIYVLDTQGVAKAASNWRLPISFLNGDYGFRPYFNDAMAQGSAEFFSLGTVSGRPGLYLSRRMDDPSGRPLGVVVVKVEFDALEAEWRASGEPAYVVDARGVTLITSIPEWRFRTVRPLDGTARQLSLADRNLEDEALRPLSFQTPEDGAPRLVRATVGDRPERWMHASIDTATPGWTLHLLAPARGVVESAASSARIQAALIVTLIAMLGGIWLRRRQQAAAQREAEVQAVLELERRIDERTTELREANAALNRQIRERRRAEVAREQMRDELTQAGRLAVLGQIAASVAHEINQPVAVIQTQAESASVWLERADLRHTQSALDRIRDMTVRIGAITRELRAFSRKSEVRMEAVPLSDAIDGALVLVGGRLRAGGVEIRREAGLADGAAGAVRADRVRLEQVIVNLLQNAAEALEAQSNAVVTLSAVRQGGRVRLTLADNGPGVATSVRKHLFTPFVTTRPKGLGLGLVICRDIVAGFGGELILAEREAGAGAVFVVDLKAA